MKSLDLHHHRVKSRPSEERTAYLLPLGRRAKYILGLVEYEEMTMGAAGAVFQPELIQLMKAVLDEAAATLPESKRTSTMMAEMASQILACAARGERDSARLTVAALSAVVERSHYSHDISPERRAV